MGSISLRNVGHRTGELLFSNLNFVIGDNDRLGLVAPNGRGKTTLLRALAGQAEVSEGEITHSRGLTIGYVPQDVPAGSMDMSLRAFIAQGMSAVQAEEEPWRADMVLEEFEFPEHLRELSIGQLSGGWQRIALLARGWVSDPDLLLLDEPTNHLDLNRIMALETWLRGAAKGRSVVIASHDRAFLDATTNRTLFLRDSGSVYLPIAYSEAREQLDRVDASNEAQRERELKKVAQLRKQAAKHHQYRHQFGQRSADGQIQAAARAG